MAEVRGFRNSSSSRIENKLKARKLTVRKIEKERVAALNLELQQMMR